MIPNELEIFTANDAVKIGVPNALKRGELKLTGSYEILPNGKFTFDQNNFTFKDKFGTLRVGRFKNEKEILAFAKNIEEAK